MVVALPARDRAKEPGDRPNTIERFESHGTESSGSSESGALGVLDREWVLPVERVKGVRESASIPERTEFGLTAAHANAHDPAFGGASRPPDLCVGALRWA